MRRGLFLAAACLLAACAPGRDCPQYAEGRTVPCSVEWKCPGGTLRWTCDAGTCECVEGDEVTRRYASSACPFAYGDGAEQAGEANGACGWAIPYNP